MLRITIEQATFELEPSPEYDQLPDSQADTLRLLIALAHINHPVAEADLVRLLGLRSHLPLRSRLEHLMLKGLLKSAIAVAA